jgi:hypothetical protein
VGVLIHHNSIIVKVASAFTLFSFEGQEAEDGCL